MTHDNARWHQMASDGIRLETGSSLEAELLRWSSPFRKKLWPLRSVEQKIDTSDPKWSQVIPSDPKWSQVIPSDPKWSQVIPSGHCWSWSASPPLAPKLLECSKWTRIRRLRSQGQCFTHRIFADQLSMNYVWDCISTPSNFYVPFGVCVLDLRLRSIKSERFWNSSKGLNRFNRDGHLPGIQIHPGHAGATVLVASRGARWLRHIEIGSPPAASPRSVMAFRWRCILYHIDIM